MWTMTLTMTLLGSRRKIVGLLLWAVLYHVLAVIYFPLPQGEFVEHDLDLSTLGPVVQYWRGRCLPPAAPGVVRVLGLVPVQDVAVYLQYYSLPVLTVLLTPIVRLCLALRAIYTTTGTGEMIG